jgi:Fic family protein
MRLVSEISELVGIVTTVLGDNVPSPMLRKANRIKTIHSSLAIEHNTLSLKQVKDIIDGKHVLGAPNEIQEVKNALQAYQLMSQLDAFKEKDLLRAHELMMLALVDNAGCYRHAGVGVFDGDKCIHMAPPADRVPALMADLFEWVKKTDVHPLVSSCVFHYEFEFIHPFIDGNGRMGRYWQTMLLSKWKGIFSWIPVETIVKEHQQEYYDIIAKCDAAGSSTVFIEFMLRCLLDAMKRIEEEPEEVPNKLPNKVPNKLRLQYPDLSDAVWDVYQELMEDGHASAATVGSHLGISDRMVRKHISVLRDAGIIERIGGNKTGYWKLLKK